MHRAETHIRHGADHIGMGICNLWLRVQQGQGFLHKTAAVLGLVPILPQPLLQLHDPALAVLVESQAMAQHLLHAVQPGVSCGDKPVVRTVLAA